MSAPTWLVVPAPGQPPVASTPQAVQEGIATSRLAPGAPVSLDGGRCWVPALHALEAHRRHAADVALVLPIGVEPNAFVAGYLAILSVLFFGGPLCGVAAVVAWDPSSPVLTKLGFVVGALVLGPLPVAWVARRGHRALRADPTLRGMGRVWTGHVCAALMTIPLVVALVGVLARALGA